MTWVSPLYLKCENLLGYNTRYAIIRLMFHIKNYMEIYIGAEMQKAAEQDCSAAFCHKRFHYYCLGGYLQSGFIHWLAFCFFAKNDDV